ncbi:hypothetical protein HMN09_00148300 [Mycena chlorophos]|uniref:Uncharacterized protein n=1 Tax=Mycena chlorophos TaxID=658473 RepID=A0A8H6TPX4_MYCCL|nr:hypothetical protein HMN09_00148300 [Mycena chlorophos]
MDDPNTPAAPAHSPARTLKQTLRDEIIAKHHLSARLGELELRISHYQEDFETVVSERDAWKVEAEIAKTEAEQAKELARILGEQVARLKETYECGNNTTNVHKRKREQEDESTPRAAPNLRIALPSLASLNLAAFPLPSPASSIDSHTSTNTNRSTTELSPAESPGTTPGSEKDLALPVPETHQNATHFEPMTPQPPIFRRNTHPPSANAQPLRTPHTTQQTPSQPQTVRTVYRKPKSKTPGRNIISPPTKPHPGISRTSNSTPGSTRRTQEERRACISVDAKPVGMPPRYVGPKELARRQTEAEKAASASRFQHPDSSPLQDKKVRK